MVLQMAVLVLAVKQAHAAVLGLVAGEAFGVADIDIVAVRKLETQRVVVIFKEIDEGVHFFGREAVGGQQAAVFAEHFGPGRTEPGVRPQAAEHAARHADAAAPGGHNDAHPRALHGLQRGERRRRDSLRADGRSVPSISIAST